MAISIDEDDADKVSATGGRMIFTETDFENAEDSLMRMLIRIFLDYVDPDTGIKGVTYDLFKEKHYLYMKSMGASHIKTQSDRNNTLKALNPRNSCSYKAFKGIVLEILGLNLVEMTYKFADAKGKKSSFTVHNVTY